MTFPDRRIVRRDLRGLQHFNHQRLASWILGERNRVLMVAVVGDIDAAG